MLASFLERLADWGHGADEALAAHWPPLLFGVVAIAFLTVAAILCDRPPPPKE